MYFAVFAHSSFVFIIGIDIPVHVHILCVLFYAIWPLYIAALGLSQTGVSSFRSVLIGILLLPPGLHLYTIFWNAVRTIMGVRLSPFLTYLYLYLYYMLYYWLYKFCKQKAS